MSRTKSFIRGFASTTAQKILTKLIGLVVTPIVLSYLDKTEYGIWVIIGSVLGYMGLMDFGITGATTAIVAKSNTPQREAHINTIINNAFALQIIIGLLIIIFGIAFSSYFPTMFNIGNYSKENAWLVFVMAIIGYGISFPPKSLKGLIRARQMISLAVWLEFILFIIVTALNLYLLSLNFGLMALPLGTITVRLLAYPVYIHFAKKSYPQLHFDFSLIKLKHMKEIFGVSAYWFVGMIAAMVIYSTDTILIGIFMSTAMVTMYALTFRLSEVLREFIYSINFTLMPGIGQIMGSGDKTKARDIYLRSQPIILSLAAVGAVFIYLFNQTFVDFWVGDSYFARQNISLIFGAILFTSVVFHASSLVISADLKLKEVTIARIVEAIINIVLSIWLIQSYGLNGVALATLMAAILTSFWYVPYITMRHLNISFKTWIHFIGYKIIIIFLFSIASAFIFKKYIEFSNTLTFLAFTGFCIINALLLWIIALDKETKGIVYAKFKR